MVLDGHRSSYCILEHERSSSMLMWGWDGWDGGADGTDGTDGMGLVNIGHRYSRSTSSANNCSAWFDC